MCKTTCCGILFSSFILLANYGYAQDQSSTWNIQADNSVLKQSSLNNVGLQSVGLKVNKDDITPDQDIKKITLTPQQYHQAMVWEITPDQEKRYLFLMANKSGLYFSASKISPVWILGINARSDEERQYYANLAAKQHEQYLGKLLAWNKAFQQQYDQLVVGIPVIRAFDVRPFSPYSYQPSELQSQDILNLFISVHDAVQPILDTVLTQLQTNSTVNCNIYFVGHTSDSDIQSWANEHSISKNLVSSGQITLNQGDKTYDLLHLQSSTTPLLLLVRNGKTNVVNTGQM